jgi:hypothetical protein
VALPRAPEELSIWRRAGGELLKQQQHGTFGRTGGVVSGHGSDFGQGFVDAADGELGAFPAERAPAEPGTEGPGGGVGSGGCGHGAWNLSG